MNKENLRPQCQEVTVDNWGVMIEKKAIYMYAKGHMWNHMWSYVRGILIIQQMWRSQADNQDVGLLVLQIKIELIHTYQIRRQCDSIHFFWIPSTTID